MLLINHNIEMMLIVLLIMLLRCMLKKLPRKIIYSFWRALPIFFFGLPLMKRIINETVWKKEGAKSVVMIQGKWLPLVVFIWGGGIVIILLHNLLCVYKMKKCLDKIRQIYKNIFVSERISVPFSIGLIHPRIYLPESVKKKYYGAVVLHEKVHISRKDHWSNQVFYAMVVFCWIQPLMWIAYHMFVSDTEIVCDEIALKEKSKKYRMRYAEALIEIAYMPGKGIAELGYAGGKIGERIEYIRRYNKDAGYNSKKLSGICIVFLLAAVLGVGSIPDFFDVNNPNNRSVDEESVWLLREVDKTQ